MRKGNRAADEQDLVTQGIHRWGTDNRQQTQMEFARYLEKKTVWTGKGIERAQGQEEFTRVVEQNRAT